MEATHVKKRSERKESMNREFLKGIEGLTDEAIDRIMAENGKDIEKEKGKAKELQSQLQAANESLTALQDEIGELKKENPDELKVRVSELEQQIADRKAEDEKAVYEKNMLERFEKAAGEGKFVNDLTRNGIFAEFKAALEDKANKGKGDGDIYEAITKDREGIFASENPAADIPGMGEDVSQRVEDAQIRAVMGLSPKK